MEHTSGKLVLIKCLLLRLVGGLAPFVESLVAIGKVLEIDYVARGALATCKLKDVVVSNDFAELIVLHHVVSVMRDFCALFSRQKASHCRCEVLVLRDAKDLNCHIEASGFLVARVIEAKKLLQMLLAVNRLLEHDLTVTECDSQLLAAANGVMQVSFELLTNTDGILVEKVHDLVIESSQQLGIEYRHLLMQELVVVDLKSRVHEEEEVPGREIFVWRHLVREHHFLEHETRDGCLSLLVQPLEFKVDLSAASLLLDRELGDPDHLAEVLCHPLVELLRGFHV